MSFLNANTTTHILSWEICLDKFGVSLSSFTLPDSSFFFVLTTNTGKSGTWEGPTAIRQDPLGTVVSQAFNLRIREEHSASTETGLS